MHLLKAPGPQGAIVHAEMNLGAPAVSQLVDVVPVLPGDGRTLFENTATSHMALERTRLVALPGVTHRRFRVVTHSSGHHGRM
jgi:hypothetical protein